MKISQNIIYKIFLLLFAYQSFLNFPKVESAENIKIVYNIFSRTIKVESLKNFADNGSTTNT